MDFERLETLGRIERVLWEEAYAYGRRHVEGSFEESDEPLETARRWAEMGFDAYCHMLRDEDDFPSPFCATKEFMTILILLNTAKEDDEEVMALRRLVEEAMYQGAWEALLIETGRNGK